MVMRISDSHERRIRLEMLKNDVDTITVSFWEKQTTAPARREEKHTLIKFIDEDSAQVSMTLSLLED